MSRVAPLVVAACVVASFATQPAAAETRPTLRRFALVAGANDGGRDRVRLRYATTDAEAFARVLEELGGVTPSDRLLLLEPNRSALAAAFQELAGRVGSARGSAERLELVLYYSGHSDDEGLLLQGARYAYSELRAALAAIPADVRLAVLDSCSSGALTRRKGGVRRPPFLVDASGAVRGHAFLTSSSEHEAAQESDRIQASYFTHYLVSGLRGAADVTPDGRVTLNEAYQFAFAETLRQTERTQAGPQHPAYDIQLQGTGDLVMTDLRSTSASLVLAAELGGRFYVHDAHERLVAELYKPAGRPVQLGLAPGDYSVRLDQRDALYEAQVQLAEGEHLTLGPAELRSVSRELTAMRGLLPPQEAPLSASPLASGETATALSADPAGATGRQAPVVPFKVSILPDLSTAPVDAVAGFSFNLFWGQSARIDGAEIGLGVNITGALRGAQIGLILNQVEGDAEGVQVANTANIVGGRLTGLQSGGTFNIAGGGEFAQLSGMFNLSRGEGAGLQTAAGFNSVSGSFHGAQLAAGFNYATGSYRGLQVAVGANLAGDELAGVQAAIVNIGGDISGAQLGLINVARRVGGLQLGLINVAEDVDVPIGLVNFVRQGQLHLDVTTSSDEPLALALRFGSKYVYSFVGAGLLQREPERLESEDVYAGAGLGLHVPVDQFFFDLDVFAGSPWSTWEREGSLTLGRLRLSLGYRVAPHFAVFASGAANVMVGVDQDMPGLAERSLLEARGRTWRDGNTVVRLWPGVVFGLRI